MTKSGGHLLGHKCTDCWLELRVVPGLVAAPQMHRFREEVIKLGLILNSLSLKIKSKYEHVQELSVIKPNGFLLLPTISL